MIARALRPALAAVLAAALRCPGSDAFLLPIAPAADGGANLVADPGFDRAGDARATWRPYGLGFEPAPGAGRGGGNAIACRNDGRGDLRGASIHLALHRTNATPIVVSGWSRAEGIDGAPDSDYALYVDIVYADGTPLWGQTAPFACGTHDWQRREFAIVPERPVRELTLYTLFRRHAGQAWFDDVALREVTSSSSAVVLQGRPMTPPPREAQPTPDAGGIESLRTDDGLELRRSGGRVTAVALDGAELPHGADGGFLAWDLASTGSVRRIAPGPVPDIGLRLEATFAARADHLAVDGVLADTTGRDRAICLMFALPVDATGWSWGDDIRRSRTIAGAGEYANTVAVGCGTTGTMSFYPLGAIWSDRAGLALSIDMARPAQFRIFHHAGLHQLVLALDLGLAPETGAAHPGGTPFRFVIHRFDPHGGFRSAFDRHQRVFPEYYAVRAKRQGLWMPFTDVATVPGHEDFGFRFHEGDNNVPFDDAHDILSFRYTEPMTWWMTMSNGTPRTAAAALALRNDLRRGRDVRLRAMAESTLSAGMTDRDGAPALLFRDEPWCRGVVWSLNPNPHLPGVTNAATVHWSDAIRDKLYGPQAKGRRDGEYLDSLEGYVTADLNFRRDHFAASTVPLVFDRETLRPALFKGLAVFEFTKWIADDLHRMDRLLFANGVPYRFAFLCPWLDVLGTETDWMRNGVYRPPDDATLCRWRTMAGGKPYLLLMNTDYDAFDTACVERYFRRALAWGMWPGFFSHNASDNPYWRNPKWFERDRPLFRRYLPLVRRVAEAGWQPLACASSDNAAIAVERFGPAEDGRIYLTAFNASASPQRGTLSIEGRLPKFGKLAELVAGTAPVAAAASWPVELGPDGVAVFELSP